MFRSVSESSLSLLVKDIDNWHLGEGYELIPYHDYWNLANGIARGAKLKSIIKLITSENVEWEYVEKYSTQDLEVSAPLSMFSHIKQKPITMSILNNTINTDEREELKRVAESFKYGIDKDADPVILLKTRDRIITQDGNARVARALIHERNSISAWMGHFTSPSENLQNYWVSSGYLLDLVSEAKESDAVFQAVRVILQKLFNESEIAKINYKLKVLNNSELNQKLVLDLL